MSTRPTARQQAREQTMQRILEISRTQLETHGVAGLSLREVTRELGMVSSAVYRYVAGRDELLTLLLVDAYEDLANTVDAALAAPRGPAPVDSPVGSATERSRRPLPQPPPCSREAADPGPGHARLGRGAPGAVDAAVRDAGRGVPRARRGHHRPGH